MWANWKSLIPSRGKWASNEFEGTAVSDLPSGLCEVSVVSLEGCEVSEYVWVDEVGVPEVNLGQTCLPAQAIWSRCWDRWAMG